MGLNQRTDDRADDGQGTGELPVPRHGRAALLRLATWFEEAEPDRADALATAAYGLHAARHLEGRVDDSVAATTSWWQAEPDRSTVTEHPGTRPPEPVRDHRAQQARLRDAAESSAHWRRAGAAQIRALLGRPTGHRHRLDLSGAGMEVLMDLLTAALGSGDASRRPTSAGDLEFALRLHVSAAPGAEVTVLGEGGELTLEGLRLCVTAYEQHVPDAPSELDAPWAPTDPAAPTPHAVPASDTFAAPDELDALGTRATSSAPAAPAQPGGYSERPAPAAPPAPSAYAAPTGSAPRGRSASGGRAARHGLTAPTAAAVPEGPSSGDSGGPKSGASGASTDAPVEDAPSTGNLPGPDPDVETTGPIDMSAHRPGTRAKG